MPKWNEQQKKAIYTMDKNILISASAGSGKTTVLIARLLHLVKDKRIEIDHILAMTFTEAAANEMKKRLTKQLQEAIQDAIDEDEKNYLNRQLANMSKAYISTIHGFCLQIITHYYYVIGLDKETISNVMDTATESILFKKSMKTTFLHFTQDENFLTLTQMFSAKADSNQALTEAILALFHLASAKPDAIAFLESCRKDNISAMQDYDEALQSYFYDYLLVQVEGITDALVQARYYYEENGDMQKISEKIDAMKECIAFLKQKNYTAFREMFLKQSLILIKKIKDQTTLDEIKKELEALEDKLIDILYEEAEFITRTNHTAIYINTLIDVCIFFLQEYNEQKKAIKMIDFSDMEHFALQILQADENFVAKQYQQQFYEIMVDEFQDSNDVQDTLVKLICKSNNVFRVGDIKQSIYGFRHATPEIMRSLIENKAENDEVIYLNNNYRSKKSIVDFNNYLFHILMNSDGFASRFSEFDHTKIGLDEQAQSNVAVKLHLISEKSINEDRFQKFSRDELKANYIASQIIHLKNSNGYQFKDFVVLIKTNAKSEFLRTAFESLNIPYFINMKHGFYNSSALQNVIVFLKALIDPHDDLSFCALMLSPFFQFNDEDLSIVQLNKKEQDSYYSYLKTNEKLTTFNEIAKRVQTQTVSETLQDIFYYHNYYEDHTTKQEKTNLDMLYEMVCDKERKQAISLMSFLTMIEEAKDNQIGEAIPISNNDDVVRVMSIHQSKGLQFPVVFLFSVDTLNLMDTKGMIAFDDTLGIALNDMHMENRVVYTGVERIAINHKATKAAIEEEMRVLYVATTRAQKEMYIIDVQEKKAIKELNKVELYKKKSFTSWIMQSCLKIDSNLLQIQYIDKLWENEIQPSLEAEQQTIEKYNYPINTSSMLAPSETEIFTFTPAPFHIDEDRFTKRGSDLHKMIELLPDTEWNQTILRTIAEQNHIVLSSHDFDVLSTLNDNDIFKSTRFGKIYHELPFMVTDQDTIIHGFMDYIAILDHLLILIDFKSDRNAEIKDLLNRYHMQLETYQKALHLMYPQKEIHAYIYSFELKQMIAI